MSGRDSILKSQKIILRKRKLRLKILGIVLGAIVLIVVIPIFFVRIPWFAIKNISVAGNQSVDQFALEDLVKQYLSGNVWLIFPKSTFLTFNASGLEKEIETTFPTIIKADISMHIPNTIGVYVTERQPTSFWCTGLDLVDCFIADNTGYIYATASAQGSTTPQYTVYVGNIASSTNPIGQMIADKDTLSKILILKKGMKNLNLKITQVVFKENQTIDFNLTSGAIYVSLMQDINQTLNNLGTLFLDPKTDFRDGSGGLTVSYIDLRFGNKIFYK